VHALKNSILLKTMKHFGGRTRARTWDPLIVTALRDAPAEWSLQFERLGLARA
jgi:hypothetical protein